MSLDSKIVGAVTGTGADVNTSGQLKVVAETDAGANPGNVGAFRFFSENDPGEKTGAAHLQSPETSSDYRLRVGVDSVWDDDNFNYTAQTSTSTNTPAIRSL